VLRRPDVAIVSIVAVLMCVPSMALAAGAAKSGNVPLDWNVSLRGQYTVDGTGGHYKTIVAPEATLSLGGPTGNNAFSAGGEISVDSTGTAAIDELHATAHSEDAFDEDTSLTQDLDLTLEQLLPTDSTLPVGTTVAPLEFTGKAQAGVRREFEPFYVTGTGSVTRFIEGPSTVGGSSVDNTSKSYWLANAGLRLGYEITPLMSVFVDGQQNYQKFDAPDPTISTYLDGATTTLQAGVAVKNENYFSAEASAGWAWHNYTDGALTDRGAWVYNANIDFSPDDALNLGGSVNTIIAPSTLVPGDTDVQTAVAANVGVKVGEGVKLRGSADWSQTNTVGTGQISNGYSVGTGLDFSPSAQTVWSADYLVKHSFVPPGPATDSQAVTLGIKVLN
jgi:hypothetical protein